MQGSRSQLVLYSGLRHAGRRKLVQICISSVDSLERLCI
jgi:hypothetical protein